VCTILSCPENKDAKTNNIIKESKLLAVHKNLLFQKYRTKKHKHNAKSPMPVPSTCQSQSSQSKSGANLMEGYNYFLPGSQFPFQL